MITLADLLCLIVAVENVQNRLRSMLSIIQDWEQKTRAALKEKLVVINS